jgi:hypothetical protein
MGRVLALNSIYVCVRDQKKERCAFIIYRKSSCNKLWYSIKNGRTTSAFWFQDVLSFFDTISLNPFYEEGCPFLYSNEIWHKVVEIFCGTKIAMYEFVDK